ncbi:MAG TPA: hypothetical protein VFT72_19745 [Opitutaceae bacterium]|nr:hypothetical protein [Opitutaceae bacterium]
MLLRSWPVRYLITRAARAYGFLDPVALMAKLRGFAQPSEVAEPIELLRAGMLFHARGLLNTKAIQNNLDWVWPFWVERQFNPGDESFIPRAFSFSHINLTHRNWTAVGIPDVPFYPLVDPRGMVTPSFDSWSLDFWLLPPRGPVMFPSKLGVFQQSLSLEENLRVNSIASSAEGTIETDVSLEMHGEEPHCRILLKLDGPIENRVAIALRPYNPEGISTIDKIDVIQDRCGWTINARNVVSFDQVPQHHLLSAYADGDVSHRLVDDAAEQKHVTCPVGMATAAAIFTGEQLAGRRLEIRAPIYDELDLKKRPRIPRVQPWAGAMSGLAKLTVSDARIQKLYDLALANLILHSPGEVYPGPFTYKRFWFRDAAFVLHALLALGGVDRTRRALDEFAPRQSHNGYFLSQEGEWDSNGEAIWTYHRFARLTGEPLTPAWIDAVAKGARWITKKRLPKNTGRPEAGLLPAGFSAEHLGPNDFYYWDDFWSVAGLRSAAELLQATHPELASACRAEADEFLATIERSFPSGPHRRFPGAIPASPKRRMDSGAIGSLVADYPLQLFAPGDPRILKTADYLQGHSMHGGGFFQNMIHSGINAYLTLHMAQVRLRAGDAPAAWRLIDRVADLASPTGQWPEAIHPRTFGGCMGDGQHIWAAGEWALMIRNCFVREEGDRLVIGSGVANNWIPPTEPAVLGPTLTPWGPVTVFVRRHSNELVVTVTGAWRSTYPTLSIEVPGFRPVTVENAMPSSEVTLLSSL